jgi:hypothetical protein
VAWNAPTVRRSVCEVFVASLQTRGRVDGQRFVLPPNALGGETDSARQIFLQEEAARWAVNRIENDLLAWIHVQPEGTPFPPNVELTSAGSHALHGLWVSGRLRTSIDYLQNATLCEDFREELRQLREMPTLEQADLPGQR